VEGYITAVQTPDGFDVNGTHVTTVSTTTYRQIDNKGVKSESAPTDALRVGAYVQVVGTSVEKTLNAESVLILVGRDKNLKGFGVIEKVVLTGSEPVFQADGYRIRIASGAVTTFSGGLKMLADVGTNTWVKYEGKRSQTGELVATRAEFFPARQGKIKPILPQAIVPNQDSLMDANGNFESLRTKVRLSDAGGNCGWHRVPADKALQERVLRVGLSVVPSYQKQLADDSSSKIRFRFYAIDDAKTRSEVVCDVGIAWGPKNLGLVLVPKQMVERLKSDDTLAAVMADGVAYNMQQQSARLITEWRELYGAEIAASAAASFAGSMAVDELVGRKIETQMQEQRGRIALALLADAGYDPWQAPEAWRLLAPKHLPKDLDSLKYPNQSGYLLGILNLQYRGERTGTAAEAR
jgi:hypothetical protein